MSTSSMPTDSHDEFVPATATELSRFVAENAVGAARAIYPAGGRTALSYGYPPTKPGISLSTLRLNKTIDYPVRDMTITVEAGVRMDELTAILQAEGQRLPVDVAQSPRATLGGVVATNTSGPRRFGCGTMRDYLIGITAVDAAGTTFHAGGRVVKNVAGYDFCKLLTGSMGTLAVMTQLTLKLKPVAQASALMWCRFNDLQAIDRAVEQLMTSAARPVALETLDPQAAAEIVADSRLDIPAGGPVLCLGVEGTERETSWQIDTLQDEVKPLQPVDITVITEPDATKLWYALTEFPASAEEPLTFRANMRASETSEFLQRATQRGISVKAHAGNGIVVGHLPDEVTTAEAAGAILTPLRSFARQHRGNLVILDCDCTWKEQLPVFGDPEPSWTLMNRLKAKLDPQGILNPGRFLDGQSNATS